MGASAAPGRYRSRGRFGGHFRSGYCNTDRAGSTAATHSAGGMTSEMKTRRASTDSDPGPSLRSVNSYLEKNFPDFFAEARFQVGDDDYFLYARFGQYLARSIEQNRAPTSKINRGFTVLNKMA